ncbi:tail fiber domain-containing protein [Hymenobacter jeollabukensis]|uniref:tail fiber domain-containing protein n=1 Tax=Hymenobacter jeollabukensis TaxID=2025313 RepID=UPI0010FDA24B|nr:tail fiber domain-containing protein [Hymenobacter jeollabukensis]
MGTGAELPAGVVGVGVRADGGLNLGQNTAGNLFVGYQSGRANTSGFFNRFIGLQSGFSNTTGNFNQCSGNQSGFSNTTGLDNQFDGMLSGYSNTTGNFNQFSGYRSGYNNTTGSSNWAFGYQSGPTTGNLTNAEAIGYRALVGQSNTLALGGTGSEAVRVGIGTPVAQLEVQLPSATAAASLKLEHRGSNLIVRPLSGGGPASVVENTAGSLLFNPSGGNVGIGTAAPAYTLDVAGTIRGNNVSPSDARFKQQVRPLRGALAGALALRGVRYRWNALGVQRGGVAGAEQVGLLAQEVEQVYPELVSTDAAGYKAVNYAQLTPVLLEALRELAAQNQALQTQVDTLQAQQAGLQRLEQRVRALEAATAQAAR